MGPRPVVDRWAGTAAEFHGRSAPDDGMAHLWWFDVDRPALVLGSSQPEEVVDRAACAREGVEVVRRHSGGGAVLLVPDHVVWLDVVLPAGDTQWLDDVGRASWWLGDAWAAALADLGVPDPQVHHGPMVVTPWSPLVCFAGLGAGEVTAGGRKLVGISQRRTRTAARFQCALQLHDVTPQLLGLLRMGDVDPSELSGIGSLADAGVSAPATSVSEAVEQAVTAALSAGPPCRPDG